METHELYEVRMNYRRGMPKEQLSELTGIPVGNLEPLVEIAEFELNCLSHRIIDLIMENRCYPLFEAALHVEENTRLSFKESFQRVSDIHRMSRRNFGEKYGVGKGAVCAFVKKCGLRGIEYKTVQDNRIREKVGMELIPFP